MTTLFYGILLSAFSGLTINEFNIGPLFSVGAYFLIRKGITELDPENPYFKKVLTLLYVLMGLVGASFVLYVLKVDALTGLLGIATFVIDIIVMLSVIKGIQTYSDILDDKKEPIRLFKRWRMRYILVGVMIGISLVAVIAAIGSVSWASMIEFGQAMAGATAGEYQAVLESYMDVLQPLLVTLMVWVLVALPLAITTLVFEILYVVSMYRIQKDYKNVLAREAFEGQNKTE